MSQEAKYCPNCGRPSSPFMLEMCVCGSRFDGHPPELDSALPSARMVNSELVRAAISAEPELPGPMPDPMWQAISSDRDAATECLRIVVRETKQGILKRLGL